MGNEALDVQIQALRCDGEGVKARLEVWPQRRAASRRFFFADSADGVREALGDGIPSEWRIIDAVELHRLLFPERPPSEIDALLKVVAGEDRSIKALWGLWEECEARLDKLPRWALEEIAQLMYEIDSGAICALLLYWASAHAPEGGGRWRDSFEPTVKRVERPVPPPAEECTPLDVDSVASYLEEGGALSRLVEGYEPRKGQIQMLRAVTSAFGCGRHLIVEAGTGIGKSLAYLLPAALWAKLNDVPVVVSTNTKNLQTQLVEKDLPAVLKMLETNSSVREAPLATAVIKGRANYLCLRRFGQMLDGGKFDLSRPDMRMLAALIVWAVVTPDGDFDALTGSGSVDPRFTQHMTSTSEECSGKGCPYHSRCFIQKAREKALRANLVIANHSLVFAELGSTQPVSLPAYSQIVFDEAHNLEEAATRFFTKELTQSAVSSVIRRLSLRRGRKSTGALHDLVKRVESGAIAGERGEAVVLAVKESLKAVKSLADASDSLFKSLHGVSGPGGVPRRYRFMPVEPGSAMPAPTGEWADVRSSQTAFSMALADLRKSLVSIVEIIQGASGDELNLAAGDAGDISAAMARLDELAATADTVLAGADDSYVFWAQRSHIPGAMGEAMAAPLDVGEFLSKNLYERKSSVVLCSATLSVAGSFNYISSRLGFSSIPREKLDVCVAPSPFDYLTRCALLVPSYLPEPVAQDRSYVGELSDLVLRLAIEYHGRTLVLFTSYEMMMQSAALVRSELEARDIELLVQGESGSRNSITRIFRKDSGTVLFGTQSFWEGVDVVGDALSCVVVARLPFASPTDPVISARCEKIENEGGRSFFSYSIPMAVLKLRQGFGRLIRHRNDHGSVIVADTRIVTKGYGTQFRNSLPATLRKCLTPEEVLENLK